MDSRDIRILMCKQDRFDDNTKEGYTAKNETHLKTHTNILRKQCRSKESSKDEAEGSVSSVSILIYIG